MPVCTNCAAYVDCVYTKYSENNIRLEQCVRTFYYWPDYETKTSQISHKGACRLFADRYVEEDALNLTLDLILMKGVILHLLYNRGTSPRRIEGGTTIKPDIQAERAAGEMVRVPGWICVSDYSLFS
jgi:lipid intermediate transporter